MFQPSHTQTGAGLVPVWLAIGAVFALIIGAGTGVLAWHNGDKLPAAILKAGSAFVATITVVILIIGLFPK